MVTNLAVAAVVNSTLRNIEHQPETVRPVLLLVAQVAATQPQLSTLPEKALKVGRQGARIHVCARICAKHGHSMRSSPACTHMRAMDHSLGVIDDLHACSMHWPQPAPVAAVLAKAGRFGKFLGLLK